MRQGSMEGVVMNPDRSFWANKRVLLTGHTGFKGSWLALWLSRLGAKVTGVSLPPATTPNLFSLARVGELLDSRYTDIRDAEQLAGIIKEASPDIVFHLAAQALVRTSYHQPLATLATNIMGTAHVLDALRGIDSVKVAVIITTDKVYKNQEWPYPYREEDTLGGHDPYSASKAAAEIVTASYRDAFLKEQGVAIATARAGNVIGGGDWSEDRLIPDAVRAWAVEGHVLEVRSPEAVRPWQHVLEPLSAYLLLAQRLWQQPELAGAYNFGPENSVNLTVREVIEKARACYGQGEIIWGGGTKGPHEAGILSLEVAKARTTLGVIPSWTMAESIERTMHWYFLQRKGVDARDLCTSDLAEFASKS